MADWKILEGDCLQVLKEMEAGSVHCCVTSPPYFGLRAYLKGDSPLKALEVGSEETPAAYVEKIVAVAREVRRVLRDDGTFWLNVGDSYASPAGGNAAGRTRSSTLKGGKNEVVPPSNGVPPGLKPKDLCLVPQRLVIALQADGWRVRSIVAWTKPAPMPESVMDRPTTAWEHIFMLTKSSRYFYDKEGYKEPASGRAPGNVHPGKTEETLGGSGFANRMAAYRRQCEGVEERNCRNVWRISSEPLALAHYAAFPSEIPRRCISLSTSAHGCCPLCLAPYRRVVERSKVKRKRPNEHVKRTGEDGTGNVCGNTVAGVSVQTTGWEQSCQCPTRAPVPCTVLDPFAGAATTGLAALRLGRRFIGVELSPEYCELGRRRILSDCPLFNGKDGET